MHANFLVSLNRNANGMQASCPYLPILRVSRALDGIVDRPEGAGTATFPRGPSWSIIGKGSHQMKSRTGARGPYGPNIVRAWFDTVFHYALQGLENEREFLTRRNWTFRCFNRDLEYLCSAAMLVPAAARENLDQLVTFFPDIGGEIAQHDGCELRLAEDCRACHEAILGSSAFHEILDSVALDSVRDTDRDFREHFGAYSLDSDFRGILAEYLVNNVEDLPGYYSTARLWNQYHNRFSTVLATPEVSAQRRASEESGCAMRAAVEALETTLKRIRAQLSLEFDVPYVAELSSVR